MKPKPKMDPRKRDYARRWQRHFGVSWTDAIALTESPRAMEISKQVDAWVASGEWARTPVAELRRRVLAMLNEPMPTKYNVSIADDEPLVMDADATEAPGKP